MRKIYFVLGIFLMASFCSNSQGIERKSFDKQKGKTITLEETSKLENVPSLNALGCDTLLFNPDIVSLYGLSNATWGPGNGYLTGTNIYQDKQFGNVFDVSASTNSNYVTGARFALAKVNGLDLTKQVYFRVYNLGPGGITLAGSTPPIPLSVIQPLVNQFIDFTFPSPIEIPNKAFIISFDVSELSWAAKDSVSIYTSNINAVNPPDSAVVLDSDDDWYYISATSASLANGLFVYLFPYVSDNTTCTLLPVTLTRLSASQVTASNKLSWSTLTENGNKGFEIQRSSDGNLFTKLGFVASSAPFGNSSKPIAYEYIDENPLEKGNFYRIKQIDHNGKTTFSNIALLNRALDKEKGIILNYPNPVRNSLSLQFAASAPGNNVLTVTNLNGVVVLQQPILATGSLQNINLNVSNLPKGIYIIKLSGETKVSKFIKE